VLELLREEKTAAQISSETGIHQTVLSRWKAEAIERMTDLFGRKAAETEKLRKEFEAKEDPIFRTLRL